MNVSRGAGVLRGLLLLCVLAALLFVVQRLAVSPGGGASTLIALGLLIFGGYLTAMVGEAAGFPHVTGYLVAGLVLGPHALDLVSTPIIDQLKPTSSVALGLIALSAGAELDIAMLRRGFRGLAGALAGRLAIVPLATGLTLLALSRFIPFLHSLTLREQVGGALLWGVIALSCSPSTTLSVISELRPKGPLTLHVLSVVITVDLLTLVAFSLAQQGAAAVLDPSAGPNAEALREVGANFLGSVACGTSVGLIIAAWLKLVNRQLLLFVLVVAYAGLSLCTYFHFEPLLLFLTAGFVVANVTGQGATLLGIVGAGGQIVFVLFFALAGAHVDLSLVARLWPLALVLWLARGAATVVSSRLGVRLSGDAPVVRTWGGLSLLPQAGMTITLASTVGDVFPALGQGFASLAIAVVVLNELFGPLLFKWALDRSGESRHQDGARPGDEGLTEEPLPGPDPRAV